MEEKESSFSGSPGFSDSDSPPKPVTTSLPHSMTVTNRGGAIVSPDSAAITTTTTTAASGGDLLGKKKRGRPRKYDSDGNLRVPTTTSYQSPAFAFLSKKIRGGYFGSTAGGDFTPHVVTVHTGEDVAGKIISFAQTGSRGICILSANGAISNVTMRQPGSSGGLLTYEGRFEILSLSGSFTVNDNGSGIKSRNGGLSVSLAGPDGRVIGGGVAGLLIAASPIQVVMGSFMPNGYSYKTHKKKQHRENTVASPTSDTAMAPRPIISQANPDGEICLTPTVQIPPQNVTSDKHNNKNNSVEHFNHSEDLSDQFQRPYPDMNISLPAQ